MSAVSAEHFDTGAKGHLVAEDAQHRRALDDPSP